MSMLGFTAEASFYRTGQRYNANAEDSGSPISVSKIRGAPTDGNRIIPQRGRPPTPTPTPTPTPPTPAPLTVVCDRQQCRASFDGVFVTYVTPCTIYGANG